MVILKANNKQLNKWDDFIDNSINGTIFHKQRFLGYHGAKFKEGEEHLVVLNGQEVFAQISICVNRNDNGRKIATSPYGASYGGFVFKTLPSYKTGKEIVKGFIEYLKSCKIEAFKITQPSNFYCSAPMDTFIFNLFEAGFTSTCRDILSVFELNPSKPVIEQITNSSTRNQIRQAEKKNILINNRAPIDDAYPLIEATIKRFGKSPTHSYEEMKWLYENFSAEIYFIVAYYNNIPIASVTNFSINKKLNSSFYISSNPEYLRLNAMRYTISSALQCAQNEGYEYYDFGTSSSSMVANEPIFALKEDFSKVGLFRETLIWCDNHEK